METFQWGTIDGKGPEVFALLPWCCSMDYYRVALLGNCSFGLRGFHHGFGLMWFSLQRRLKKKLVDKSSLDLEYQECPFPYQLLPHYQRWLFSVLRHHPNCIKRHWLGCTLVYRIWQEFLQKELIINFISCICDCIGSSSPSSLWLRFLGQVVLISRKCFQTLKNALWVHFSDCKLWGWIFSHKVAFIFLYIFFLHLRFVWIFIQSSDFKDFAASKNWNCRWSTINFSCTWSTRSLSSLYLIWKLR